VSKKVSLIDCGSGNILSVARAFKHIEVDVQIVNSEKDIIESDRLIFPGVGAFSNVISYINKNKLFSSISNFCSSGKPFLGICLGMQVLFEESEEFGKYKGFGFIEGKISPIRNSYNNKLKIPHTNWNSLYINDKCNSQLKPFLSNGLQMYFSHSYMAIPRKNKHILAHTLYGGIEITAIVQKDNLIGCQFHPEKSGKDGLYFLKSFMDI